MDKREKQIFALRTAIIAGTFSLVVGVIMLLNFWQIKTTDPLESEALKSLVERLQEDTNNEALKVEIRNLDLMTRNAFFTNQWQIRSGAYLLIAGLIVTVIALRIYHSSKAEVQPPNASELKLDIELLISRRWILVTASIILASALIASYFSMDHLSKTYALAESESDASGIPVQEIKPFDTQQEVSSGDSEFEQTEVISENSTEPEKEIPASSITNLEPSESETISNDTPVVNALATIPSHNEIIKQYPAFRGPYGLGITYHKNIPVNWSGSSNENVLWKIEVPLPGFNSPVIWDKSVFLSGADKDNQSIYCYNLQSGMLSWEYKVTGIKRPSGKPIKTSEDTGFAAPTVTTDGRHVYAIYATGDLVCLNMQGKPVWSKNLGIPDNHYGHSSSLLVWKNLLYIQFDTNKSGNVKALNALSGALVWETNRSSKISWASPILANYGDRYELVLSSSPAVAGYDPETGKELWSLDCLSGEVGPSLAFDGTTVYASNEYANLVAIKPDGANVDVVWESNEYLPEVASPVIDKKLLFIGTSYGVIACFNTENGELIWEYECNNGIYASPIIADGKVYFIDMDGIAHIFEVSNTLKLIGEPELGEMAVSTPAFADNKILIRGYDHLYCIGK